MEIFVGLFLLWVVVTLIGHGSWVIVRALFSSITDQPAPTKLPSDSQQQEIAASHRVVSRMLAAKLIDHEQAVELHRQLRNLEFGQTTSTIHQPTEAPSAPPDVTLQPTSPASQPLQTAPQVPSPLASQEVTEEPILATLCDPSEPAEAGAAPSTIASTTTPPATAHAVTGPPAPPALSKAELIQSFLAAHNIRWGELVAGILIVVCSIGLVISLWSTLVDTHRVIPSLIFLGATAAIYAAGLYTLSRWRLRHTSRAVLVIATLLVPLSVLAGLAAAGTDDQAVQLSDPITLGTLAVAGLIYTVLLWLGGKALTGPYSRNVVLSVVGPVIVLPLMPAAVRSLQVNAGWCVGIGSAAIVLAVIWMIKMRRREQAPLGVVGSRSRLLVMSVSGFALAVSIGYAFFAVREFGLPAFLPIAIAAVPALIALAAAGRSLMIAARSATQSMVGAVTCVMLFGICWAIMPQTMGEAKWLWTWASVLSISGIAVGWILKQPRWLPVSTLPLGLATVISSPVWLSDAIWANLPFWKRIIGGEPMLAATLVAAIVSLAAALLRDPVRRRWMGFSAIFWIGFAITSAGVLSVGQPSLLGVAPWWSVTTVLGVGAIVTVFLASRMHAWSAATIAATTLAWCSVYRPIQLFHIDVVQSADVWMFTTLSIAATLMAVREIAPRLKWISNPVMIRSSHIWENASVAASVIAAVIACLFVTDDWKTSASVVAGAAGLLFWASTASRSIALLRVAQLTSIVAVIIVGDGQFSDHLLTTAAWKSGLAPWGWAILAATVTGFWFAVRELSRMDSSITRRRMGFMTRRLASAGEMIDGWTAIAATTLVVVGAARTFAAMLAAASSSNVVGNDAGFAIPLAAIASGTSIIAWMRRHQAPSGVEGISAGETTSFLFTTIAMSTIVWLSSYGTSLLNVEAVGQLVIATSTAALGCVGLRLFAGKIEGLGTAKIAREVPVFVAGVLAITSSAVLLRFGWLEPISEQILAHALPTFSVAAWWLIAAEGLGWIAKRDQQPGSANLSAILMPAAVAILVPAIRVTHPLIWIQCAAIASLAWVAICRQLSRHDQSPTFLFAKLGSLWWASAIGITTAALVMVRILFDVQSLNVLFGPAGAILSLAIVTLCCLGRVPLPTEYDSADDSKDRKLAWPVGLTLLAGQAAWLIYFAGFINGGQVTETVLTIWCVASALSLLRYQFQQSSLDFWHTGLISVALMAFAIAMGMNGSTWMPWVGMVAAVTAGMMVACVGNNHAAPTHQLIVNRVLGWATICLGLLVIDQFGSGHPWAVKWTVIITWIAAWVVAWRISSGDRVGKWGTAAKAIPDVEFSCLMLIGVVGEWVYIVLANDASGMIDSLLWLRMSAYVCAALSTCLRSGRKLVWPMAIGTFVSVFSLISLRIAIEYEATLAQRAMLSMITASFVIAFIAHALPLMAKSVNSIRSWVPDAVSLNVGRLVQATLQIAFVLAAAAMLIAMVMIATGVTPSVIQLTIVAVALIAWTVAELAELSRADELRHMAVTLALITIGLWASVDSGETMYPWLSASMRWLVASVFTIPMVLFVVPRLLGENLYIRWQSALRRAAMISAVAAVASLIVMLGIEAMVRSENGIAGISRPMVIGVAVTLAILSGIAGLVAILSGSKGSGLFSGLSKLSDHQRRLLIIAAQAIGGITWLHVFLCKTQWAFIGLRGYWPFIVMGLAFVSVGVTEWAKRRGDKVLSDTISHTALYLPLIPVVGFWLSGSFSQWAFTGGVVRYDALLAVGAVYYIGLSAMWKRVMPRITAVVLGNAALWVVLVQRPDWSFLTHPQAWLIPPAVCVLVIAQRYRDRLQPAVASAIRYASTLVIYVSSTADMLLQQIGTSISGPIILVLLAMAGMLAGVILRVRPFLYLGATFVFIGVTSMVWHAQKSIDAVWPWWVFGITTGICLLAGLMALEKNKNKLREYANTLATWQG